MEPFGSALPNFNSFSVTAAQWGKNAGFSMQGVLK
jgi:hypothetical protein